MMALTESRGARLESDHAWLLLAELNHRVRNELQVALSALRLAKRQLASPKSARFIEDAVLRLEGLGNVHEVLDRKVGQGTLAQRLEALCRGTSLSRAAALGIRLVLELDEVITDEETAWTICVVTSELMTNAFKHAFPSQDARRGRRLPTAARKGRAAHGQRQWRRGSRARPVSRDHLAGAGLRGPGSSTNWRDAWAGR